MALATANSEAQWKSSVPGRMTTSTPTKPTVRANNRPAVVRSPRISRASGMTSSGAIRLIDAVLASGMKVMAKKFVAFELNSIVERRSWISGRRVRSILRPKRGTRTASMNTITGNNRPAPHMNRMPARMRWLSLVLSWVND